MQPPSQPSTTILQIAKFGFYFMKILETFFSFDKHFLTKSVLSVFYGSHDRARFFSTTCISVVSQVQPKISAS